jgi:hypothetical protein
MTSSAFVGFSFLMVFQLVNVSWVEGLESDFSNMLLEITEANGSYYAAYEIVEMEENAWILVNVSVPEENYTLNVLADAESEEESNETIVQIPYQEGFEPDFSNLLIQFVQPDGNSSDINYSVLGLNESEWILVGLERPPGPEETISILATQIEDPEPPADEGPGENESDANESLVTSPEEVPGEADLQVPENESIAGNESVPSGQAVSQAAESTGVAANESIVLNETIDAGPEETANESLPAEAAHTSSERKTFAWDAAGNNDDEFDGEYDYELLDDSSETFARNTLEMEVVAKIGAKSTGILVSKHDYINTKVVEVGVNPDGTIRFFAADGETPLYLQSGRKFNDDQTHNITLSVNETVASLYVDGVLEAEGDASKLGDISSDAPFSIGADAAYLAWMGQAIGNFDGVIKQVRISYEEVEDEG